MRRLTRVATIPVRSARNAAIVTSACPGASCPGIDPSEIHSSATAVSYAAAAKRTSTTAHPMEATLEMARIVRSVPLSSARGCAARKLPLRGRQVRGDRGPGHTQVLPLRELQEAVRQHRNRERPCDVERDSDTRRR